MSTGVHAVPVPAEYGKSLSPHLWGIISSSNTYVVRQHLKLLPRGCNCFACPPSCCVPQPTTFSVFAGPTPEQQVELIRFDEVSDDWNRCCCHPYHPWKIEARQHIPMPGDGSNLSDYSFLGQNIIDDFGRFDHVSRTSYLRDLYAQQPVLFTMQRNDGVRCCFKCPFKALSCPVCFSCCQDGIHIYAGSTPGHPENPEKEIGRPYPVSPEKLIGSVTQPCGGGMCIPFLELRDGPDGVAPFGKVAGPCCFGGWSEMCCDFDFRVSRYMSSRRSGDLGHIIKRAPVSASQAAATLCCNGEADVFGVNFQPQGNMTPQQKVTTLSAQVLLDFMLFDGQMRKCEVKNNTLYCYFCYSSILGCLVPWQICIPLGQN